MSVMKIDHKQTETEREGGTNSKQAWTRNRRRIKFRKKGHDLEDGSYIVNIIQDTERNRWEITRLPRGTDMEG